ncbi:hypothetical protein IV203_033655 [Nitzschia inconspicua]|uniref:Uncharacterized protein n=1 Tax=Nitzschia inconspicua TaxID=303405 RepID=A0A9K3M6C4_9STRA|nr:hypothetical protein IV203_033655 [Nitzschia inconspicua]
MIAKDTKEMRRQLQPLNSVGDQGITSMNAPMDRNFNTQPIAKMAQIGRPSQMESHHLWGQTFLQGQLQSPPGSEMVAIGAPPYQLQSLKPVALQRPPRQRCYNLIFLKELQWGISFKTQVYIVGFVNDLANCSPSQDVATLIHNSQHNPNSTTPSYGMTSWSAEGTHVGQAFINRDTKVASSTSTKLEITQHHLDSTFPSPGFCKRLHLHGKLQRVTMGFMSQGPAQRSRGPPTSYSHILLDSQPEWSRDILGALESKYSYEEMYPCSRSASTALHRRATAL